MNSELLNFLDIALYPLLTNTLDKPASREVLWNVSHPANSVIMYSLFAISMFICGWGLWRRFVLWRAGLKDSARDADLLGRFKHLYAYLVAKRGVNRERKPRNFHSMILWGFLALLFTTTMVAIDEYFISIYHGWFYLAVTVFSDCFGLILLLGLWLAYKRRYQEKPDKLHNSKSDSFMLGMLALLTIQGYTIEGLRIAATEDPWALYSPIGYIFSLPFTPFSESILRGIHFILWWFHTVTVFVFIALLPYTKFLHIFSSSANIFFAERNRPRGALKNPGDIEQLMEEAFSGDSEEEFQIGVSNIQHLSWKQRLDLDACTSCGRCQDVCPAYDSGKVLSPKWLILDSRDHMLDLYSKGKLEEGLKEPSMLAKLDGSLLSQFTMNQGRGSLVGQRSSNELVNTSVKDLGISADTPFAGGIMGEDVFWSCTTCGACVEVCPVGIEHVDLITDVRRSMALMEGKIPSEAQPTLRAIETRGNPFGAAEARIEWAEDIEVPILKEGEEVDVLYWVGCVSSFDKRKQKIAQSMAKILNASGISWGTLGNKECCTGDPARRMGEENLFQTSVKRNIGTLQSVKFKTLVANCPHCFNSLKNEYPEFGVLSESSFEIVHHSVFINQLIDKGTLKVDPSFKESVTFHDPCYLGRYNETYDEPRDVLVQLGSKPKEMSMNKQKGKCCGAGGGHYWYDMKVGERVNVQRVDQAAETGASTVATGCPFCMQMLEDGIKITEREDSMVVQDIAELVAQHLSA